MSNQNNHDISHVQVPDSFIQEVLNQTEPLKEDRKEIHPSNSQTQAIREETSAPEESIVELLTLMFEEFDKLNSRLDSLQESLTEMNGAGVFGVGPGVVKKSKSPRRKPKDESTNRLTALLAKRIGR